MSSRPRQIAGALVSAAIVVPAVAVAAPRSADSESSRPALAAKLASCRTGTADEGGTARFTGSMPAVRGSRRLAMRFELERRREGDEEDWERISAPTFGSWERSRPGVSGFVYSKTVEGLTAVAAYRAVVRFRWIDARGRTVRTRRRTTTACRQPDPRPNLTLERLRPAISSTGPVAELTIRNTGRGDTLAPAVVAFAAGGVEAPSQTVPPLGPGVTAVVTFPLSGCAPGQSMTATIDPVDGIDEALETDNMLTRPCP